MKCLTVQAERVFHSGVMTPGFFTVPNPYPPSTDGIAVNPESRTIVLDSRMLIRVDPTLLAASPLDDRGMGKVLRATVVLGADGYFTLIPEQTGDEEGVLALFDVGFAPGQLVVYEAKPGAKIASGMVGDLFSGDEEVALFMLKPGDQVAAVRSERKYIFFGRFEPLEKALYSFDGAAITCDTSK